MTHFSAVARHCSQNPGVITVNDIVDKLHISRGAASRALLDLSRREPRLLEQVERGVYIARPQEATNWQAPAPAPAVDEVLPSPPPPPPAPAEAEQPELAWEAFTEIPDDRDLYPPFRVQIIEKRRKKRGGTYYRIRDEMGRRGYLGWDDDEDF